MKRIVFLILFSVCAIIVLCGEDHYNILGIPRDANDQQIKKAFKKASLKWHPDKNKQNPDKAKDMFAKCVNAYETLKDPEKRRVYDHKGEEGVREHDARQQQQQQYGNYDDMFGSFFGGGGGRFHFNFGGGGGGFHQQQQAAPEDFFANSDVYILNIGALSKFFRRDEVWIILFYKPGGRESKEIREPWKELAQKWYGIFKVAAVDCEQEEELCIDEFEVRHTPEILVFPSNIRSEPKRYEGEANDVRAWANLAVSQMENFVTLVSETSYDQFIAKEGDKNKILLFTQKKSTPPLYRALSKDLKGKLVFGEVRQYAESLIKKFQITNFPTLLVITDSANYKGTLYDGPFKKDQMMKFLREFAYQTKKVSKGSGEAKQLSASDIRTGSCGENDNNMCAILLLNPGNNDPLFKLWSEMALVYKDAPISWFLMSHNLINYTNLFKNEVVNFPSLVILRGKKSRFSAYSGEINEHDIKIYIDGILGGSGLFKPLGDKLENQLNEGAKEDL